MRQALIPAPTGPGDLPAIPERPEPIRATPPPPAAVWDELFELRKRLDDVADRLKAVEERVARLEGPRH